jgi:hypothetical protein
MNRRCAALALAILLTTCAPALVGCGSGATAVTKDSTAGFVALAGDGFTLKLPSKTTRTVRTVPTATGTVKAVLYSTGDDPDGTYLVALTAYPAGTVVDLDKAVAGAAKNIDGVVRENGTATYRGHDARDGRFTATSSGTEITVFVRMIDLGGKLFQLQYAEKGADVKQAPDDYEIVAASVRFSK